MSRSKLSRIESGRLDGIPVDDLDGVFRVLDARLELEVRWRGATLDRLLDERHASLVDATVRWLAGDGWSTQVEASFAIRGERGSIDVFARHDSGALLVIEVKASIGDVNQTLIALDRKARLAPLIAQERGWPSGPVSRILVVGETTTSRTRIAGTWACSVPRCPRPPRRVVPGAGIRARLGLPASSFLRSRILAGRTPRSAENRPGSGRQRNDARQRDPSGLRVTAFPPAAAFRGSPARGVHGAGIRQGADGRRGSACCGQGSAVDGAGGAAAAWRPSSGSGAAAGGR